MSGRKLFIPSFPYISCGSRVVAVALGAVMRFKSVLVMSLLPRDPHHSLGPIGNSPYSIQPTLNSYPNSIYFQPFAMCLCYLHDL